jgi:hypothetical protein
MTPKFQDPKTRKTTTKMKIFKDEPVGIDGWPPISTWITISFPLVVSMYIFPYDGSKCAVTFKSPTSNIISLLFKFMIVWLSKYHSNPISVGYGLLSSMISITSKFSMLRTPSILTGTPLK